MVEKINKALEEIGSKFRTEDGYTIVMYLGNMMFLKREFHTQEACFRFVTSGNHDLV